MLIHAINHALADQSIYSSRSHSKLNGSRCLPIRFNLPPEDLRSHFSLPLPEEQHSTCSGFPRPGCRAHGLRCHRNACASADAHAGPAARCALRHDRHLMGAGVHPDIVDRVAEWPVSMAMLIAVMVAVTFAGYAVLHYGAKWSRETAYFGAIPGALSYVIALATERGADLPRIASSQSLRLFVLVAVLPFAVVSSAEPAGGGSGTIYVSGLKDFLIGIPLCLAASWLAIKARVPGAV